jgi:hypothetical protein
MRCFVLYAVILSGLLLACTPPSNAVSSSPPTSVTNHQHATIGNAAPVAQSADRPTSLPLEPGVGGQVGFVYEAFLSPHQEPGEEQDTPALVPAEFRSTAPSLLRKDRTSRGHGIVRFSNDLRVAYVDVQVENVSPAEIVMFHIHCGRPDQLGPILVDFGLVAPIATRFTNGTFTAEITNSDIEQASQAGEGVVGVFTAGCPIVPGLPDKVKTIAGMEYIARQGELYFNVHTKGQTFYGDLRGQIHLVAEPRRTP